MAAMTQTAAQVLQDFADIVKPNEPLAPYTFLKVGGPAEVLAQPRSQEELAALIRQCTSAKVPFRVLGGGCNIVVRDEGVPGVVLRLSEPAFTHISVQGKRIRAGAGAAIASFISAAARQGLAGMEALVGIPGTIGGALRCNAGDRSEEIGQYVRSVEVLDESGQVQVRERDELRFAYAWSNLDDPVLLAADFDLEADQVDRIIKRLRKAWILRKASQPLTFQAAARIFKNPRGQSAAALLGQAGLAGTRVGGAEVSDRDANFIVAQPGTSARDILRLIDMMRSRVREHTGVELELEISVW
jgi:UDP-N-acetylmuramate dehydrogenase